MYSDVPLLKNQHFQIPIRPGISKISGSASFKSLFIYFSIYLANIREVISLHIRCDIGSRHRLNYNISV